MKNLDCLERLKEEYKNLKTEEETREWLANIPDSEIEYINGKRVLAGGAGVIISGGRIYVGVTTASAGFVLLGTPLVTAGGVLTLGGSGEAIFGLNDLSVGVQDIYYGLIESEKETYDFFNYISGNFTLYVSEVKRTYYDKNIFLKYKDIENIYLLTKTEDISINYQRRKVELFKKLRRFINNTL